MSGLPMPRDPYFDFGLEGLMRRTRPDFFGGLNW